MFIVLRIISLILIVLALMLLGADCVTSLENGNGAITVRSLEAVWAIADRASIDGFKALANNNLPAMVTGWIFALLAAPGWAVTGVIGVVLAFLFGRRAGGPE